MSYPKPNNLSPGRLVFSLNDDGTVTLRCDADAFFAHADVIRKLLAGEEDDAPALADNATPSAGPAPAPSLLKLWSSVFDQADPRSRDLSLRNTQVLTAGYYLTCTRGFGAFTREDLSATLADAPNTDAAVKTSQLVHLTRKGWLERVRRGSYRLSQRGKDRIASLRRLGARPRARSRPEPELPTLTGLSRFIREVPANRKWRRVLLVIYFLHVHCGVEEFDARLLGACFQRLRGHDVPGSLPALISQVLHKRHGVLERGSRRGRYRITAAALEELQRNPRVAEADALHRAATARLARTG